jgi:hypothetical protein
MLLPQQVIQQKNFTASQKVSKNLGDLEYFYRTRADIRRIPEEGRLAKVALALPPYQANTSMQLDCDEFSDQGSNEESKCGEGGGFVGEPAAGRWRGLRRISAHDRSNRLRKGTH